MSRATRVITGAVTIGLTAHALWPVVEARMTYESESSHVGTYDSIADLRADTPIYDYYSGRTFTDRHEYAEFKDLPIGDAMDASAADIDTLITLAVAADAGITAENYNTDRPTPATMTRSVFADTIVEACQVLGSTMTVEENQDQAADACERLERDHLDYQRAGAWTHAISHFRRTCETEHATAPEDADPRMVAEYLERTTPRTLDYIVPPEAVEAGDPGALKAKPLAERWLRRIEATATKDACLTFNPSLARPLHVSEDGSLVVDYREQTEKGAA